MYSNHISSRNARRLEKKMMRSRDHVATVDQRTDISPRNLALHLAPSDVWKWKDATVNQKIEISPRSLALYLSPYDAWERELVSHLDKQPRPRVWDGFDPSNGCGLNICHHNVDRYCRLNRRAKHVLGCLDDGSGYILHSVVEIEGILYEITPFRVPHTMPFIRDDTLRLSSQHLIYGNVRAVITRDGREMPHFLRTPQGAEEDRREAERLIRARQQAAFPSLCAA